MKIKSWGNTSSKEVEVISEIKGGSSSILNVGNLNSYGDSCIPKQHLIVENKFIKNLPYGFTPAFITIGELLNYKKKYLLGIPGKSNVTLAGAISSDSHGKDNTWGGGFSRNIDSLYVQTANGKRFVIERSSDLFQATVGGYGLICRILGVKFKNNLIRAFPNLKSFNKTGITITSLLTEFRHSNLQFKIAWVDLLSEERRWVFIENQFIEEDGQINIKDINNINLRIPMHSSRNLNILKQVNNIYYKKNIRKSVKINSLDKVLFPLSSLTDTRNFAKNGQIYQVQFSVQYKYENQIDELIKLLCQKQIPILCSIKQIKSTEFGNNLSFLQDGFTIAIDFSTHNFNHDSFNLFLKNLKDVKGKIYLAKDQLLNEKNFKELFPEFKFWLEIKHQYDKNNLFQSEMSDRLGMFV